MIKKIAPYSFHLILIIATISLIGSLYFSEVRGFAPCVLCWYQRIALYPLVPLFMIAIQRNDTNAWYYAIPLVLFGLVVSVYQNLLYFDIIQKAPSTCQLGVSCEAEYVKMLGFIDIPLMALIALVGIGILLWIHKKHQGTSA